MDDRIDVGALRRSYDRGPLDEADFAPTWHSQLERWLRAAVSAGIADPNAMVLATADARGAPSARTVLMKGFDERGLVLFTNLKSRKGREALANPAGAAVFPWLALQRQVTIRGAVAAITDAEADRYWATRPRGAQLGAHASPQSQAIASRDVLERARAAADARYPAAVPRPAHWSGLRLVPDEAEFWQGRADRLHDRLAYRRGDGGAWSVVRLAP